ncbi:MAG: SIMPL domain-containing protein [Candidatus Taylorbacteria bacterium]|nr:SIMPL domain-containing protein [Candidatus Taylorbacteria bacterium]
MNIPQNFWTTLKGLIAILIVFVIILGIGAIKVMSNVGINNATVSTINVDGTGDAIAVPDIATFTFTVSETAKTVVDAQTKATTRINSALKTVRDQGVADKDISTQSYNINPHYDYQTAMCPASSSGVVTYCPGGKSVLTGYDVSQSIQIKVRDLTKAGAILTSVGSLGVQNVNSLSFAVDEPAKVQADARNKAITDAKSKADVLAKQLGVRLVRVVSFSESNGGYPRPMMYSVMGKGVSAEDSAPVSPEIPTGEQKITSNVSITYEIR